MAEIITLDNALNASLFCNTITCAFGTHGDMHANLLMRFPDTFFIEEDFIVLYHG